MNCINSWPSELSWPLTRYFLDSFFSLSQHQLHLPKASLNISSCQFCVALQLSCPLHFHLINSADSGLADPLISNGGGESSGVSERNVLPQSTIYNWSCDHFSKPLLTAAGDIEEIIARREEREKFALEHIAKCQRSSVCRLSNPIACWDTKFEKGTSTALLQPFSPIVVAVDENEKIRVWNYEDVTLLNSFDNHDFPDKGISKLFLVNELDDSLLLVASSNGNIQIWKDYTMNYKQKLATAFSSIQGHKPGVRCLNAVVDWQQQSGYLYASREISSIMLWDVDKERLVNSIPSSSDCSISALSASQVHGGQLAAGFWDGSVRLYDVRTPKRPKCFSLKRGHILSKLKELWGLAFSLVLMQQRLSVHLRLVTLNSSISEITEMLTGDRLQLWLFIGTPQSLPAAQQNN